MRVVEAPQVDLRFIHAYLAADEEAKRTGLKVRIRGYSGWWVVPPKDRNTESE